MFSYLIGSVFVYLWAKHGKDGTSSIDMGKCQQVQQVDVSTTRTTQNTYLVDPDFLVTPTDRRRMCIEREQEQAKMKIDKLIDTCNKNTKTRQQYLKDVDDNIHKRFQKFLDSNQPLKVTYNRVSQNELGNQEQKDTYYYLLQSYAGCAGYTDFCTEYERYLQDDADAVFNLLNTFIGAYEDKTDTRALNDLKDDYLNSREQLSFRESIESDPQLKWVLYIQDLEKFLPKVRSSISKSCALLSDDETKFINKQLVLDDAIDGAIKLSQSMKQCYARCEATR